MRKFWNGVLVFCLVLSVFLFGGIITLGIFLGTQFDAEFPDEYLELTSYDRPSFLYARDIGSGDPSGYSVYAELKGSTVSIPVAIGEMPSDLIHAFLAVEDKRFLTHHGVDWLRTAEAAFGYLFGDGDFGASTITQQLVKNLTGNDARTPERKLQELFFATDLERKLDKSEILERYLGVINLSGGCSGVGAAAKRYYSVPVGELTLAECASIAAITKNPSRYDPIRHPESNLQRRNIILDEMCRQGYLSQEECDASKAEELGLRPTVLVDKEPVNSWYTDTVIEDVLADLTERYGITQSTASQMLYYGGLRVYCAMNMEIQSEVETYYADSSHFPSCNDGRTPQSSIVVIDPHSGDLLAVAGAHGIKTANRIRNLATQSKRPPASALKPLSVYAPALKLGKITWASVFDDTPVAFISRGNTYRPWPKNADGLWRGRTGIPEAIAESVNTVSVRVLRELGKDASVRFLSEDCGLNGFTPDDGEAALALGQTAYGVTLRDLTAAYTILADRGIRHTVRSYYLVTDADGNVILSRPDSPRTVLSEEESAVMTKLLEGVTATGTAKTLTLTARTAVAGKTGTSSSDFDRWFIGYTPELLCGVWYGFEYPESPEGVMGNPAVTVFDAVMNRVYNRLADRLTARTFRKPATLLHLSYCADSGGLAMDACLSDPRGHRICDGWFLPGTEPTGFCSLHKLTGMDPERGGVRSDGNGRQVGLLNLVRSFPMQLYVLDAPYTTRPLAEGVPFCCEPELPFFAYALGDGEFCGIGYGKRQYNRGCPPDVLPEMTEEPENVAEPETESESENRSSTEIKYRMVPFPFFNRERR